MQNEREDHGNGLPAGDVRPEPEPINREPPSQHANPPAISPGNELQPPMGSNAGMNGQSMPGEGGGRKRRRRRRRRGGGGGPGQQPNGQNGVGGAPHPNEGQQVQTQTNGAQAQPQVREVEGILEVDSRGNGALRRLDKNLLPWQDDPEVPKNVIQQMRLRPGWLLNGQGIYRNNRGSPTRVDGAEGKSLQEAQQFPDFAHLTSVDPIERIRLETTSKDYTCRVLDLIAPIGFGQRGLIVAAPRTGKTMILQRLAHAVSENHPKAHLIVLLVDERPEEVTDMRRSVRGAVLATSSDRPTSEHLRIAEIALERSR